MGEGCHPSSISLTSQYVISILPLLRLDALFHDELRLPLVHPQYKNKPFSLLPRHNVLLSV